MRRPLITGGVYIPIRTRRRLGILRECSLTSSFQQLHRRAEMLVEGSVHGEGFGHASPSKASRSHSHH